MRRGVSLCGNHANQTKSDRPDLGPDFRRLRILPPSMLEFRETQAFTRAVVSLLTDEEYAALQAVLAVDPEAGDLIPGTGGLRKLRWRQAARQKGKRGGVRVIYYWYEVGAIAYMLVIYSKGQQDDLSERDKRTLRHLVAEEFK